MHDWLDLTLGLIVSACGWLVLRLVGNVDSAKAGVEKHSREIRDTRSAISRIEGHLKISPFPYQSSRD